MSGPVAASAAQSLPERPSLEHLKNQARRRLRAMRSGSAAPRLAEAQLQVARDYGFASWRALKAFVDRQGGPAEPFANWVGVYRHDPRVVANGLVAISAEDGRLYFEGAVGRRLEMFDQGQGRLAIAGLDSHYTFEAAGEGPAKALISHTPDGELRLERVGPAQARAIRAARQEAEADQARPRTAIVLPPGILERYVGHYASAPGPAMKVVCRDGALLVQLVGQPEFEVFAESETRFFYRILPAQLSFDVEGGRAEAAVLHQNGVHRRIPRVPAEVFDQSEMRIRDRLAEQERPRVVATIDPAVLDGYVGRYQLDAARFLTVSTEDGRLYIEITGQRRLEVHPESEREFFWTVVAAQISFVTNASGQVIHAVLHQNGRDVPVSRIDPERAAT